MATLPSGARALVRLIVLVLKLVLIVARWFGSLVLLIMALMLLTSVLGPVADAAALGSWQRLVLATLVRLVLAVPLAGIVVLLLHPVRAPVWLLLAPAWPLRWLLRRVRGAGAQAQPAPIPAAPALSAQEAPAMAPAALPAAPAATATPAPSKGISRRRFLIEGAAVGAILADMMLIEPNLVEVISTDVPLRNLPERFHGFRIAQISDLHISPYTTVADLARLVQRVNGLGADVILVTGDFVDRDKRYAAATIQTLRDLRAPDGVYTVVGNHDYYADRNNALAVTSELQRYDLGFLRNTHTVLRRGADKLYLMGTDDPTNFGGVGHHPRANLSRTLAGTASDAPRILMIHNPIMAPEIEALGVDLAISGHTHGGQVRVPYLTSTLVKNVEYFDQGLFRFNSGGTQFYVNRGFGTVGPPMRLRARPEVSLLRLVPA